MHSRAVRSVRSRTLRQVLAFHTALRDAWKPGLPIQKASQAATRAVAARFGVGYATIQEACVQRMGYRSVDEQHEDLEAWLRDDRPRNLVGRLKAHAPESSHREIDDFFGGGRAVSDKDLAMAAMRALPEDATIEDAIERLRRFVRM